MVIWFRKVLIRFGKTLPFILVFFLLVGYIENVYSISFERYVLDGCETATYYFPINEILAEIVYIDWLDVLLLYILAFALEFCKYNLRAVHIVLVNQFVRYALEKLEMSKQTILCVCVIMCLLCIVGLYGAIKQFY